MNTESPKIAVIGLGYVGLPLARLFATKFPVIGFDINAKRVEELQKGHDSTLEVEDEVLQAVLLKRYPLPIEIPKEVEEFAIAGHCNTPTRINGSSREEAQPIPDNSQPTTGLYISRDLGDIQDCNYYMITVPTPVDKNNRPSLTPLYKASESVGRVLKKEDIVIYESTVYPGATEEECIPVLEEFSNLKFNEDFFVGYSPERINPGDKEHTVEKILKVTSGSTPEIGIKVDN